MPSDYTTRTAALTLAKSLVGITDATAAPVTLEASLDDSAGRNASNVLTYRPYFAAGHWLRWRRTVILAGDGATFRDPRISEDDLIAHQARLDAMLNLIVPAGFAAFAGPRSLGHVTASVTPVW